MLFETVHMRPFHGSVIAFQTLTATRLRMRRAWHPPLMFGGDSP